MSCDEMVEEADEFIETLISNGEDTVTALKDEMARMAALASAIVHGKVKVMS